MNRTSPWDEIDATLLGIAKTSPTLAELVEQSGLTSGVVKDLAHAYVRSGWLAPVPFSPTFMLTVVGRAKLASLAQAAPLAKAA